MDQSTLNISRNWTCALVWKFKKENGKFWCWIPTLNARRERVGERRRFSKYGLQWMTGSGCSLLLLNSPPLYLLFSSIVLFLRELTPAICFSQAPLLSNPQLDSVNGKDWGETEGKKKIEIRDFSSVREDQNLLGPTLLRPKFFESSSRKRILNYIYKLDLRLNIYLEWEKKNHYM